MKAETKRARTFPAVLLAALLAAACGHHDHDDHGHAHDEHPGEGHGHSHEDDHSARGTSHTDFTDATEAFVEVAELVAGRPAELVVHLTWLSDFGPVRAGRVAVALTGEAAEVATAQADAPDSPGIFRLQVRPKVAGPHRLRIELDSGSQPPIVHDLGPVLVRGEAEAARPPSEGDDAGIRFGKELQWRVEFALSEARRHRIRPSFEAYGHLRARPDGEALVTAPLAGRLSVGRDAPRLGADVKRGEVLFSLTPRLADQGDASTLEAAVRHGRIAVRQARAERDRLQRLLASGSVPERRVLDARFTLERAQSDLAAARRRLGQARSLDTELAPDEGQVPARAPLAGTIVSVDAVPGAYVAEGDALARVVDLETLWLEVHVAETHAGQLQRPQGAWFVVEGLDTTFEVGSDAVVTAGGVVDPRSRTVPLYLAVPNPRRQLRVGLFAEVHVLTDAPRLALAVPVTAIQHEQGVPVVYVQRDGEHFDRRVVRVGQRDGSVIEVLEGLVEGERVVSRGAYMVRLAGSVVAQPGHGHAH